MKQKITIAALLLLFVLLSACDPVPPSETPHSSEVSSSSVTSVEKTPKIGICFPTESLPHWRNEGNNLKETLEAAGYEVDLQFGGDSHPDTQIIPIAGMISDGCDVLVIDAGDGMILTEVLKGAKGKNIPVIAYQCLIMNSDTVSYYITFDKSKIGYCQGRYIVDQLDLANQDGPFYIELFAGAAYENDDEDERYTLFFWNGAMEVLWPYIDSGKLVVVSGEIEIQKCLTTDWAIEYAQMRMENLISSQGYGPNGLKLDAVLSPNDSIAQGITNALVNAGYTADNFPIITGFECDVTSTRSISEGTQSMSVFTDTNDLVERTAKMVTSIVNGEEPEINDRSTYDNGFGPVPTYLCEPTAVVTKDNYKEILIDSGYYTEEEISD